MGNSVPIPLDVQHMTVSQSDSLPSAVTQKQGGPESQLVFKIPIWLHMPNRWCGHIILYFHDMLHFNCSGFAFCVKEALHQGRWKLKVSGYKYCSCWLLKKRCLPAQELHPCLTCSWLFLGLQISSATWIWEPTMTSWWLTVGFPLCTCKIEVCRETGPVASRDVCPHLRGLWLGERGNGYGPRQSGSRSWKKVLDPQEKKLFF